MAESEIEQICPRLEGETLGAYRAFIDAALSQLTLRGLHTKYLAQKKDKSTTEKPPTTTLNTLGAWSKAYNWQERIAMWRSHCLKKREQRMIEEWDNHRVEMISQAKKLTKKANEMLNVPLLQQEMRKIVTASRVGEEIATQIIIKPARWDMRSAAAFFEVASDLMKAAVGDVESEIEHLTRLGYLVVDPGDAIAQQPQENDKAKGDDEYLGATQDQDAD